MNSPSAMIVQATYPAPWRVEVKSGTNRAVIMDHGDSPVMSGVNILKARIIVAAVNRDHAAPDMLAALILWERASTGANWDGADTALSVGRAAITKASAM
jgi:hypothetical protein